jgi:hypothetical protein
MGGDGFVAPFAAYVVKDFQQTGAVGGGSMTFRVTMDEKFCSLISFFAVSIQQGTPAAAQQRVVISADQPLVPTFEENFNGVATATAISIVSNAKTFNPPPQILPGGSATPFLRWQSLNVDADVYSLNAQIMLFNIRARELAPMGPLLWARGST